MLFFGAVNAFAQDPDTFLTRSYTPNLLDTMVGLIDDMNAQGVFDDQLSTSISDAKFLLQDLKDGVIDSGNPSQAAVEIAKEAETYLEFLYDVAKDKESEYASAAINKLTQALEIGRNTIVKGIQGFTVDASGKLVGPG